MSALSDRDAQIMKEARAQREHDLTLAEMKVRENNELARQVTLRRESRHQMMVWVAGISGAVAVILTIVVLIANATSEDRAKELKLKQQQNDVAQTCITAGNIWLNGDCIPTKS